MSCYDDNASCPESFTCLCLEYMDSLSCTGSFVTDLSSIGLESPQGTFV